MKAGFSEKLWKRSQNDLENKEVKFYEGSSEYNGDISGFYTPLTVLFTAEGSQEVDGTDAEADYARVMRRSPPSILAREESIVGPHIFQLHCGSLERAMMTIITSILCNIKIYLYMCVLIVHE